MNAPILPPEKPATLTSFVQLFGLEIEGHTIREIEIPLIQRDFAQGRKTERVNRIRDHFVETLCQALLPDANPIDLDFVFGDVEVNEGGNQGKFYPLDGQQRLTTLFLLHCYLAWRTQNTSHDQAWHQFSYATRPGAREFCRFLVKCKPSFSGWGSLKKDDSELTLLPAWLKDHADYLPTWQHDPTVQSMLVVLDAFHDWFSKVQPDMQVAWQRLTDSKNSAICFHLLPMKANNLTDALYIKMNSRGKPLTDFENFKAHFEDVIKNAHSEKTVADFALKVDTDWSDILWTYRGDDNLIDDEFIRYFRFVTEVCAWKNNIDFKDSTRHDYLAEQVYGAGVSNSTESLTFLFHAFDVWMETDPSGNKKPKNIKAEFESILTSQPSGTSTPLLMFNSFDREGVDCFQACCRHYGARQWTLAHTLLLYGVLLKFIHHVTDTNFQNRLRILRNLLEASSDEIRAGERNNMPKLLAEVEQLIVYNNLDAISTFNQVQVGNEKDKATMLQAAPALVADLHRLEDHDLLRGGLTVFDLDPVKFAQRTKAFISVFNKSVNTGNMPWKLVTSALLAKGDYSRQEDRWTGHRFADFGAPKNDEPWQTLLRGKKGEKPHPTLDPLMALLDAIGAGCTLPTIIDAYLNSPGTLKDWRYYFVKYDSMREGASGRYAISPSGYQACMLEKWQMNSNYRDTYLFAMLRAGDANITTAVIDPWFYGYETDARHITLRNSALKIQCVDQGWQLSDIPTDPGQKAAFDQVAQILGIQNNLYPISQQNGIDIDDRIELGVNLLKAFVVAGL